MAHGLFLISMKNEDITGDGYANVCVEKKSMFWQIS